MKRRRWDAILDRIAADERVVGVEVGVWKGKNAQRLLTARHNLTLYLVDPWKAAEPGTSFAESGAEMAEYPQDDFDMAKRQVEGIAEQFGRRAKILEMDSADGAKEIKRRGVKIDFVFIDSDHSYDGVMGDLDAWLELAIDRGAAWIGGHDYANKNGEVKRAVDEVFNESTIEIDEDHTWFVRLR